MTLRPLALAVSALCALLTACLPTTLAEDWFVTQCITDDGLLLVHQYDAYAVIDTQTGEQHPLPVYHENTAFCLEREIWAYGANAISFARETGVQELAGSQSVQGVRADRSAALGLEFIRTLDGTLERVNVREHDLQTGAVINRAQSDGCVPSAHLVSEEQAIAAICPEATVVHLLRWTVGAASPPTVEIVPVTAPLHTASLIALSGNDRVFLLAQGASLELWSVSGHGKTPSVLLSEGAMPRVSRDGSRFAYHTDEGQLFAFWAEDSAPRLITSQVVPQVVPRGTPGGTFHNRFRMSADGAFAAFHLDGDAHLQVSALEPGGAPRPIATDAFQRSGRPHFTTDNRFVLYERADGAFASPIDGGGEPRALGQGVVAIKLLSGSRLAVLRPMPESETEGQLFVVDLERREEKLIAAGVSQLLTVEDRAIYLQREGEKYTLRQTSL